MGKPPDDYQVGYTRPPQDHRWTKGQTGNPRRRTARRPKSLKTLVDEYLAGKIWITENGKRRRCTRFEAICLQLEAKVLAGKRRAFKTLLAYVAYSREGEGGVRLIFQPSPETDLLLAARRNMEEKK